MLGDHFSQEKDHQSLSIYCSHLQCPLSDTGVAKVLSARDSKRICSPVECFSEAVGGDLTSAIMCRVGNSLPARKRNGGHLQECWKLRQGGVLWNMSVKRATNGKVKQHHKS